MKNSSRSSMYLPKPEPVDSLESLRGRIERLIAGASTLNDDSNQLSLGLPLRVRPEATIDHPSKNLLSFLTFLSHALPDGDVYLFGGVLRDLALFGRRGFTSDIDLVVEGSLDNCLPYLNRLGATKNKFGGFRLRVGGWPVDIWKAEETWAIRQQLIPYKGIGSLIYTTVLNWDAILMNWRTRQFVCRPDYIDEIQSRLLDIVLAENPNPLGTLVRVLRHFCLKDAKQITTSAADYLGTAVNTHSFESVRNRELQSFGNAVIEKPIYTFFKYYGLAEGVDSQSRIGIASDRLQRELGLPSVIRAGQT